MNAHGADEEVVISGEVMIGISSGWLPRFGMAFAGGWGRTRRIRGVMLRVVLCEEFGEVGQEKV